MNISQRFVSEIDKVAKSDIPSEVMARARRSFLDYLAVTCAGVVFQEEKMKGYFAFAHPENGEFNVIGMHTALALKEAVFLNGLNAHALDFDDGTNSGIIHLGSPIFSLLLPLCQRYNIKLESMLKAAIIGYEASFTMAVSIQPRHKALGYHATGTCGMLGATLAAAYMLDFSEDERYHAFSTACVSASGMLKVLDDGSELKPYNVAKTALLSLTSLQLAKAGFKGHSDPLGGYRGFMTMMTGNENTEIKPTLLNGTYAIMKSYTKPYASCRYTHPSVEAVIHLRNRYGIKPEDVESIKVLTYNLAVSGHDHTDIHSSYSAKMSIPYSTAAALEYGKAGLLEFSDTVMRKATIQNLTNKVEVIADKALSDIFPEKQSAIVSVSTKDCTFTERVDYPKGEPENPFSEEEFYERFSDLMQYGHISREIYDSIYDAARHFNPLVSNLINHL